MEAPYTLPEDNPKKIYFSIKEVASFIGVEQSNLRYWEKEFAEKLKTRRDSKTDGNTQPKTSRHCGPSIIC